MRRNSLAHLWPVARRIGYRFTLTAACAALLAACAQAPAPPPEPAPAPAPTAEPAPPPIERRQLLDWLDAADAAMARDHLTFPLEGSALEIYDRILALDPDQEDARRGHERIVERYVALALNDLEQRRFASARSMLARGRLIIPDHPSLEPTAAQLRLLEQAERTVVSFDQAELAQETAAAVEALNALGNYAPQLDCRFFIWAKNDAQGRWLYRQLAADAQVGRLRAQVVNRLPARVERLCFGGIDT